MKKIADAGKIQNFNVVRQQNQGSQHTNSIIGKHNNLQDKYGSKIPIAGYQHGDNFRSATQFEKLFHTTTKTTPIKRGDKSPISKVMMIKPLNSF